MYELITVLGPTASGKTSFAVALASHLETEIISGDSRQVYRRMDIGTGKDLKDYRINGVSIPYHLIDICEPGTKYNVFQFQHDFFKVFRQIRERGKVPILCGGTGLYIESVLKGYKLLDVPPNPEFRESLKDKSLAELETILASYKTLHNKTDVDSAQRAIRAIEIEVYYQQYSDTEYAKVQCEGEIQLQSDEYQPYISPIHSLIIGIDIDREARRKRISDRLRFRLANGMIEEVQSLLDEGISPDDLLYYGLEYKYLTQYLIGELTYNEMVSQLEIAIHQFAKRQMTWFRGMERRGCTIHWIHESLPMTEKIAQAMALLKT